MIPYIKVPDLVPFEFMRAFPLHPFGILVASGVLIGTALATRRARMRGFDVERLNSFITWMLLAGFIGGHMLDEIFYHPDELIRRPWSLFLLWEGLSSFGGFVGGAIGVVMWKYLDWQKRGNRLAWFVVRARPQPILPFCDLILSVFPVAWMFGRSGCSTVHDHPGARTGMGELLAVAYPSPHAGITDGPGAHTAFGPITFIDGQYPRFDLGLLELMFTIILALAFAATWKRRLPTGTYVAAASLAYAPVRFAMDFLRIRDESGADPRYAGLTPAQWSCALLFAFGIATVVYVRELRARGIDPADEMRVQPRPSPPLEGAPVT